ncbi:MAG: aminoglycoside phosphotransferase family protein [Actinomycetota bacterium]|nr:aminoglycoside phosphotransferase family protein [Actinomycetota bacterium]
MIPIDEALARRLLQAQQPHLAEASLEFVAAGWDNVMFRLPTHGLLLRLPRRPEAGPLMEAEQRWLGTLAQRLPLRIPVPVVCGRATDFYPWPWSVVAWVDGQPADRSELTDPVREAERLAHFLLALHQPSFSEAPANPYRGVPLQARAALFESGLAKLPEDVPADPLLRRWTDLMRTPVWSGPPVWIHGDLHSANILVSGGTLCSVIDWGDLTDGDPATDGAIAWMLFEADARRRFFDRLRSGLLPVMARRSRHARKRGP